jgi:hypothetical protein
MAKDPAQPPAGRGGERLRQPDAKRKILDKPAAAQSIRAMLDRPAQRLIVGHADVIEEDWRDRLAQAWRMVGQPGLCSVAAR